VLDESQFIIPSAQKLPEFRAEPGEAVDKRRHAAYHSYGITEQSRRKVPGVCRQVQHLDFAHEFGRKCNVLARLSKHNDIDFIALGQVMEQRGRSKCAAPR
jgi:hypothetical protein